MDVKRVCVLLSALFISDTKCHLSADVETDNRICSIKLNECDLSGGSSGPMGQKGEPGYPGLMGLKGESGSPGHMGQKGEPGYPGLIGLKGESGSPGLMGPKGELGSPGLPGPKGDSGSPGLAGPKGESGYPGLVGLKGESGSPGAMGPKGESGSNGRPGLPGPKGPPGSPGIPGVCMQPCEVVEPEDTDLSDVEGEARANVYGEEFYPSPTICRSAPQPINGTDYWVMPFNKFLVTCDKTTNRTCLKINENVDIAILNKFSIQYGNSVKSFWLSQLGLDLKNLYKITMDQILFLQNQSTSVTQIVRYHCKNSHVTLDADENALRLLTWNDIVVGPYPSELTPMFYSIIPENHGCKPGAGDEWTYTDIKLVDSTSKRLPMVDFHIRDVGRSDQRIYLELRELCFG